MEKCDECGVVLQTIEVTTKTITIKFIDCIYCGEFINNFLKYWTTDWPSNYPLKGKGDYG